MHPAPSIRDLVSAADAARRPADRWSAGPGRSMQGAMRLRLTLLVPLLLLLLAAAQVPTASAAITSIAVRGDHLVDGEGRTVQLRGVNRSGTEYACSKALDDGRVGFGIFDGPTGRSHLDDTDQGASIDAMRRWGVNAVRIPLSDACWFGGSGLDPRYSGTTYQASIVHYVDQLAERGVVAILSLHAASTGTFQNRENRLLPMPDADQGPRFWQSVVQRLRPDDPGRQPVRRTVVYDLFNEPHLEQLATADERWACWRNGCEINPVDPPAPAPGPGDPPPVDPTPTYRTAGMQKLVDEVRAREASTQSPTRPILVGGLDYANDLSRWREFVPDDPAATRAIVASLHAYDADHNLCAAVACWDATAGAIRTAGFPVVAGELGQYDCRADHVAAFTGWADRQGAVSGGRGGISYLAWTWNAVQRGGTATGWTCDGSPSVLQDFDGTPTESYGGVFCRHLRTRLTQEGGTPSSPDPCPDPASPPPPPVSPVPVTPSVPAPAVDSAPLGPVPTTTPPAAGVVPPRSTAPGEPRTARVTSRSLKVRRGRVTIAVSCAKGATPCRGRVKVRTARRVAIGRRRATVLVLVSVAYDVRAGGAAKLVAKPTTDGRALLRRTRRVPTVATATSDGGLPVTRRLTLAR